MNLEIKINEELKSATKAGDKVRMETLRSIRAGILELQKSGIDREMNEQDELKILQNGAKKRRDAIDMYLQANRPELADKEKAELAIIEEFLPKQLSQAEVEAEVKKVITETGATDMSGLGKVMGAAMKALAGKADGKLVQQTVRSMLGGN